MSGPAEEYEETGGGSISALLREFRRSRLMTQEELATRAQLSVRTIGELENGRGGRPRSHTVLRLVESLGLQPSERLLLERAAFGGSGPRAPRPEPPKTLPPSSADFCGREEEAAAVAGTLLATPIGNGALVACAITGQPGVGKTALALHVAHRLRAEGHFADGQLYVDLQGSGATPADPADVLGRFLVALGLDPAALPDDLDGRVDRYRTVVGDRRVLVVLDNAADETQVRPLLPGGGGSAVLVTGRRSLPGLEGAHPVELVVLDHDTALRLLGTLVGRSRLDDEPAAAATVVTYCQGLPLALRIVGARLAARPDHTLTGLARRLADERDRLDELAAGDLAVRSSFALSYAALPQLARRLFRRLALAGTAAFPAWVAAPLADVPHAQGLRLVDALCDAHLLEAAGEDALGQDRYRLHDLLRLYAAELLAAEPAADRLAAQGRITGSWLALAEVATAAMPAPSVTVVRGDAPRPAVHRSVAELAAGRWKAWLDLEYPAMTALVTQAAAAGLDDAAWDLAGRLMLYFATHPDYDAWRRIQEAGLAAARRAGHPLAEASLLRGMGHLHNELGDLDLARASLEGARAIHVARGDRRREVGVLDDLGLVAHFAGEPDRALELLDRAERIGVEDGLVSELAQVRFSLAVVHLDQGTNDAAEVKLLAAEQPLTSVADRYLLSGIYRMLAKLYRATGRLDEASAVLEKGLVLDRQLDDHLGEALTVRSLGEVRMRQKRSREAQALLETSLDTFRRRGFRHGEATALRALGEFHLVVSDPRAALAPLAAAAELWRELGRPREEAQALAMLGDAHAGLGDDDRAAAALGRALVLYRQVGAPESDTLAVRLGDAT